jgi:hypothetical protein
LGKRGYVSENKKGINDRVGGSTVFIIESITTRAWKASFTKRYFSIRISTR